MYCCVLDRISFVIFIYFPQADSLGCTLRANGFNKGDRLGIWTHNMAGWILSVLAAARVGLISVSY